MITCSSSAKGLYACLLIYKNGETHFFETKEPWWKLDAERARQADGWLRRAETAILQKAELAGLRARDVMDAHFYPDKDLKRSKERGS